MERTIAVNGVGSLSLKPDWVIIGLELETKDENYERAMALSSDRIEELTRALAEIGFAEDALKTSALQVHTEYRSESDERGRYTQVFDGYVCHSSMKLAFSLDMKRLGETLSAIGACSAQPELNIAFTVKEPQSVNARLLNAAAANARGKAELLCAASGVTLGKLLRIEYDWHEPPLRSRTSVTAEAGRLRMMKNAFQADMTPEEIELSDSAAFIWEIV